MGSLSKLCVGEIKALLDVNKPYSIAIHAKVLFPMIRGEGNETLYAQLPDPFLPPAGR